MIGWGFGSRDDRWADAEKELVGLEDIRSLDSIHSVQPVTFVISDY